MPNQKLMTVKKKTAKKKAVGNMSKEQRVEIFAQAIVEGKTQSDAFRLAYPKSKNWKEKSVHERASVFAKTIKVQSRVQELKNVQLERHGATIDRVIQELSRIAFFNPKMLLGKNGKPLPLHELPDEVAVALSVVETEDGIAYEHKLTDKNRANDLLGKWFQMWTESHVPTPAPLPPGPNLNFNVDVSDKSPEEARKIYLAFKDECSRA